MKEDLYRRVGLILDEKVNVALPPDKYPALIGKEGHEFVLVEQWPQTAGVFHIAMSCNTEALPITWNQILHAIISWLLERCCLC